MKIPALRLAWIAALGAIATAAPNPAEANATATVFGNYHAAGVIVTIDASDDPDGDLEVSLSYRKGTEEFSAGLPLTRTRDTQLVGSLFELIPATRYDVRLTFSDPDGGPLDSLVITTFGTTRSEPVTPSTPWHRWVSPDGTGTSCTESSPCTLAYGISVATVGWDVLLKSGTYRVGEISLPRSGTAEEPIVIRNAPSSSPVLDGADPQDFVWVHDGSGVYSTTVNAPDTHLVTVDGKRLYPYQSLADLQNLRWGHSGFYVDGTSLRLHLENDLDPNPREVAVSRFNFALRLDGVDHIHIVGLRFRNYGQGSYAKAIYLDGASDNLIRDCQFEFNDLGIGLKRAAHRNLIENNEFSDSTFDFLWEAVKDGSGLETGGVRIYDSNPSGRGTVIRRNYFTDFFDGFGVCPGTDTGITIETDVHDNTIMNMGDDGFETDGYCSNLRIWDNFIREVLVGISLAPVYRGPVFALRNLIFDTGAGTSQAGYGGMCFKFNSGFGESGAIFLFHNTCVANRPNTDALTIKSPGSWQKITTRNNIWWATRYALSNANPLEPLDLDWDNLYSTLENELAWWDDLPDRHLNKLAEIQSVVGHEWNGLQLDPLFEDAGVGDYRLMEASPLNDVGVVLPGINDSYLGIAPDLGAFERDFSLFADGFDTGDTSRWSSAVTAD